LRRFNEDKHIDGVVTLLAGRFTATQVRQAARRLVADGHLSSTDDYHFTSTLRG
jgi:hypothetical protein